MMEPKDIAKLITEDPNVFNGWPPYAGPVEISGNTVRKFMPRRPTTGGPKTWKMRQLDASQFADKRIEATTDSMQINVDGKPIQIVKVTIRTKNNNYLGWKYFAKDDLRPYEPAQSNLDWQGSITSYGKHRQYTCTNCGERNYATGAREPVVCKNCGERSAGII